MRGKHGAAPFSGHHDRVGAILYLFGLLLCFGKGEHVSARIANVAMGSLSWSFWPHKPFGPKGALSTSLTVGNVPQGAIEA